MLPVSQLLAKTDDPCAALKATNPTFCSQISSLVLQLQRSGHFAEARGLVNCAELESNEFVINEWTLRAEHSLESFDFWSKCWHSLLAIDPSMRSALKLFSKFVPQMPSLVVKCYLVFKCMIASKNLKNDKESALFESMLWNCVIGVESDAQDNSIWPHVWTDVIEFFKSERHSNMELTEHSVVHSSVERSIVDKLIEELLNNRCIEKAQQVSRLFDHNHPDLDIIVVSVCDCLNYHLVYNLWIFRKTCDHLAKGLIRDLSEAPLSVQLKSKVNHKPKATDLNSRLLFILNHCHHLFDSNYLTELNEHQKTTIGLISSVAGLSTIAQNACRRVLLYYKISCVLNRSYSLIENTETADVELLKSLISVHSPTIDGLSLAKELIVLNKISDETVSSIICSQTVFALKNSLDDWTYVADTRGRESFSSLVELSATFLSMVRLLNDTSLLGSKLLAESEFVFNEPNSHSIVVKLYIKAHECFSLACDVRGIALVLRKARVLITQKLLELRDFKAIVRLMTGIGRYSEMTYCFELLKDNNEFELILSKHIQKVCSH